MILRNKIIPIALAAVLLGGTVGAFVSSRNSQPATTSYSTTAPSSGPFDNQNARPISDNQSAVDRAAVQTQNIADSTSYRLGFMDGFMAARNEKVSDREALADRTTASTSRVVYRDVPVRSRTYSRYSNYQPRQRTFWQKHRDKLTVAMGTGGGALLGALIGGKKGAAIGALAGGAGSAIYTYGIRKRNRTY
ncbi:MAG: hypothetical protein M3362_28570 [Acidobacteriota bacterium]|nr:hypothetical protein [Acidobacteriota bacterium]